METIHGALDYVDEVGTEVWKVLPDTTPPPGQVWEPVMHYDPQASAWLVAVTRPSAPTLTLDLEEEPPAYSLVVPSLVPAPPARIRRARTALQKQSDLIVPGADVALAHAREGGTHGVRRG